MKVGGASDWKIGRYASLVRTNKHTGAMKDHALLTAALPVKLRPLLVSKKQANPAAKPKASSSAVDAPTATTETAAVVKKPRKRKAAVELTADLDEEASDDSS